MIYLGQNLIHMYIYYPHPMDLLLISWYNKFLFDHDYDIKLVFDIIIMIK